MAQSVQVRNWRRPAGEPGDLADVIVATLSLARVDHGFVKVGGTDFYNIFSQLEQDFPDQFPPMAFTRTGTYVYSKTLGDALELALRQGVDVMNPRFYYYGVAEENSAKDNLTLIKQNTGHEFVERLRPVASRFVELARASAGMSAGRAS